jgi:hypothetical protein
MIEEPEPYECPDYTCYEHAFNCGESPFERKLYLGIDAPDPEIEKIMANPELLKQKMIEIDNYLQGVENGENN